MRRFPSSRCAPAHEIIVVTEIVAENILEMFCKNQLDVDKHLSNSCGFPSARRCSCLWEDAKEHWSRRFIKAGNNYNMTLAKIRNPN